jgi:hypothetical protein
MLPWENNKIMILKEYILILMVLVLISFLIVIFTYLFDDFILYVLGSNYTKLNNELLLMAVSACVGLLSISTNKLLSSRGIIIKPIYFIPLMIMVQVSAAFFVNLSSVMGIITYSIITISSIFVMRVIYLFKYLASQ